MGGGLRGETWGYAGSQALGQEGAQALGQEGAQLRGQEGAQAQGQEGAQAQDALAIAALQTPKQMTTFTTEWM